MFLEEKKQGEVVEAPARVLKLSDAMRFGAMIRPQCKGDLFRGGRSCALGAAYEGRTGKQCSRYDYGAVAEAFPMLEVGSPLMQEIYHRNDDGESRESIADWLESQGY